MQRPLAALGCSVLNHSEKNTLFHGIPMVDRIHLPWVHISPQTRERGFFNRLCHELILEPGKGSSLSNLINRTWKNHIFSKECWDTVTEESRGVWLAGENPKDLNTWGLHQKLLTRLLGRLSEIQCIKTCHGAKQRFTTFIFSVMLLLYFGL